MKPKVTRSDSAPNTLNYVFAARAGAADSADKRPELISSNMTVAGEDNPDPRALAVEFAAVFAAAHRLRPSVKKPFWHCSLSLPQGERLTSTKWAAVVDKFLDKMGFDVALTPFCSVRHNDKPKSDHVHVVLSRISLDGKIWCGKWEAFAAIKACQELEREFGLVLTPGLHGDHDTEAKVERPTRKSDAQSIHNSNKVKGVRKIDTAECARVLIECAQKSNDLPSFTLAAAAVGIVVKPNRSETTGHISGLSVIPQGRRKFVPLGDATGKKLTWAKLLRQFELNDAAAEAARKAARTAINAAGHRAAQVADARLNRQSAHVSQQARALTPGAIHLAKEAATSMIDDKLYFLTPPPEPRPVDQKLDDVSLVAAAAPPSSSKTNTDKRGALDRNDRERAAAEAAVQDELQSATKTQLKRLHDALVGELRGHDAEAIEQMLARFTRLVVRLLTLNQVVLPPTEHERRVHIARHSLKLIEAEIQRRGRADVAAAAAAQTQPAPDLPLPRQQAVKEPLRIVRAHDARQNQKSQSSAERDAEAKAQRERNRTS